MDKCNEKRHPLGPKTIGYCCEDHFDLQLLLLIFTIGESHGPNYIDSPKRLNELKKHFEPSASPKFILFWDTVPLWIENAFFPPHVKGCPHTNCYYTDSQKNISVPSQFDAIVFTHKINLANGNIPSSRSPHQKFIYFTMESSHYYPKRETVYDNFFNWTWTYKLSSTDTWPYFYIFDKKGKMVGPNKNMNWIQNMDPINKTFANKLSSKSKAAAWVVSNCFSKGKRENYVEDLKKSFKSFDLTLDVYGKCSKPRRYCDNIRKGDCSEIIKRDYFFLLSFENSFADDYVTEKLANALTNDVVPIVYGGADYSRFLPSQSYLNARNYTPSQLALAIKDIIGNWTRYHDFFRWKNHYEYKFLEDYPCRICSVLNNSTRMREVSNVVNFTRWWNT